MACGRDVLLLSAGFTVFAIVFTSGVDVVVALSMLMPPLAAVATLHYWHSMRQLFSTSLRQLAAGLVSTLVLYTVFLGGRYLSELIGLYGNVAAVYGMVELSPATPLLLLAIAVSEELYWRGWLQGVVFRGWRLPWLIASIPYALVHVPSGIPLLVPAAFTAGIVLGATMHYAGLLASITAHYLWLLLAFYFAPYA